MPSSAPVDCGGRGGGGVFERTLGSIATFFSIFNTQQKRDLHILNALLRGRKFLAYFTLRWIRDIFFLFFAFFYHPQILTLNLL